MLFFPAAIPNGCRNWLTHSRHRICCVVGGNGWPPSLLSSSRRKGKPVASTTSSALRSSTAVLFRGTKRQLCSRLEYVAISEAGTPFRRHSKRVHTVGGHITSDLFGKDNFRAPWAQGGCLCWNAEDLAHDLLPKRKIQLKPNRSAPALSRVLR
jgi:hypothetical protein